jgi:hypothetical protein
MRITFDRHRLSKTIPSFLNALPAVEYESLQPHLDLIQLPLGKAIYSSGDKLKYVYFPMNYIISLLYVMENGASV